MRLHLSFHLPLRALAVSCLLASVFLFFTQAQQTPKPPAEKPTAKASTPIEPQNPAQFELLETKFRFESNGDSRKEVHALVHINSELGVRQFARLNFDYNRSFQSIEIPLVHITHPSGGTADILPSAITDNLNPAVVNAPAYQDVRVKSVRILGLAPGDNLEYRVATTTSHHPLAPDFWLDHSFDRTGVVSKEVFDLDLPTTSKIQLRINPATPATSGGGDIGGVVCATACGYHWQRTNSAPTAVSDKEPLGSEPDIALTTFASWEQLSKRLALLESAQTEDSEIARKSEELTRSAKAVSDKAESIYDFVSQKIATVDVPLGSTGFRPGRPSELLSSGHASAEDKFALFAALASASGISCSSALVIASKSDFASLPRPSLFSNQLIWVNGQLNLWLDPSVEVAPFGFIRSNLRGKRALVLDTQDTQSYQFRNILTSIEVPLRLPFGASQKVTVHATLAHDGKLTAKVHYSLRGDNELLLRVAFHQSPKDKWKDLAQLLSLSDGFRGQVTSVNASDPYATREPFTLDYEITQPKFVDWSKKPVRIPALLPQIGLPDAPAKPVAGAATSPIELGTPLEVEIHMTLHLPPGTTSTAPTGTSVQREYATFASQYSTRGLTVTASRHINFLLRQVPAERVPDYNVFLRAVLTDQAQDFTLDHPGAATPGPKPAAPSPSTPSTPKP